MTDLRPTIAPKSDQLNADDLIGQNKVITVTAVRLMKDEQPIAIHYEGDNGKPYKPCKSMRRVLVMLWGEDGNLYAGRRMALYRDPDVKFGGEKVGGIRISHLSHISREEVVPLTEKRGSRKPYSVKPLRDDQGRQRQAPASASGPAQGGGQPMPLSARADAYEARLRGAADLKELETLRGLGQDLRRDLERSDPERLADIDRLLDERDDALRAPSPPADGPDFPGDRQQF